MLFEWVYIAMKEVSCNKESLYSKVELVTATAVQQQQKYVL